jgi:hypothetical protein
VLRQRGDGGFLGGHGGSRREGMNSYLDCKSFFSTTKISGAIPTRNQFGPCSQHLFGGRVCMLAIACLLSQMPDTIL